MSTKIFRLLKNKFYLQKFIRVPANLVGTLAKFPVFSQTVLLKYFTRSPLGSTTACKRPFVAKCTRGVRPQVLVLHWFGSDVSGSDLTRLDYSLQCTVLD
jgi:hypothetical protein